MWIGINNDKVNLVRQLWVSNFRAETHTAMQETEEDRTCGYNRNIRIGRRILLLLQSGIVIFPAFFETHINA
jgi:hypothetical protein